MTRLQQEIARKLCPLGHDCEYENETAILNILTDGRSICRIHPNGNYSYLTSDYATDKQVEVFHSLVRMIDNTKEYISSA